MYGQLVEYEKTHVNSFSLLLSSLSIRLFSRIWGLMFSNFHFTFLQITLNKVKLMQMELENPLER